MEFSASTSVLHLLVVGGRLCTSSGTFWGDHGDEDPSSLKRNLGLGESTSRLRTLSALSELRGGSDEEIRSSSSGAPESSDMGRSSGLLRIRMRWFILVIWYRWAYPELVDVRDSVRCGPVA